MKLRKNEMKLRKKQIKLPKNFSAPRWIFANPSEEKSDFLGGGGVGVIGVRQSASDE